MKRLKILLFFLIFSNFYSQSLKGIIKDSINYKKTVFNLKLTNNSDGKEYFSHTNQEGKYEFNDLKNGVYILSIIYDNYYLNNKFDIKVNGETKGNFYISKYCKYNENKNGICPNCKSKENVLPILYGLTTASFMRKNKNKYYFGGCEISGCDPKWFCKKDKLEF